jgi:hypothetical protein
MNEGMNLMTCPACEAGLTAGQRFCRACGAAQSETAIQQRPSRLMDLPADDSPTLTDAEPITDVDRILGPEHVDGPDHGSVASIDVTIVDALEITPVAPESPADPTCLTCGAALLDGARFCRACGAGVSETAVLQRPSRLLRAVDPAPPAGAECEICGAPAAAGALCGACAEGEVAAAAEAEPTVASTPSPSQAPSTVAGGAQGGRRRAPLLAAAGVVLLAGAATAAFLVVGGRSDDQASAAPARSAARVTQTTAAPPATQTTTTATATGTTEATSSVPAADAQAADARLTQTTATEPAAKPASAGDATTSPPTDVPAPGSAADAIYRHWRHIANGDYSAAYDLFWSGYTASSSDWIADKEANPPAIDADSVQARDTGDLVGRDHLIYVKVITRDPGQSRCNRAAGLVGVTKEDGEWRYRAGVPVGGTRAFKVDQQAVAAGDERCRRIK